MTANDPCAFPPSRTDALLRLKGFLPRAGRDYAALRNYDLPQDGHPHVSVLSPYLRHRILTEPDVLQAVLARHAATTAEKFIQEVCWRTYWKGWLELRPTVWADYRRDLDRALSITAGDPELAQRLHAAEAGETDIAAFNDWARELVSTGYMHNHARMWFASIWIFTLRLPWEIGADFFLRHLLDGDPASNTLSWRWVAGLQTQGKHYLARSSNIAKFTKGRHNPEWRLNTQAAPLNGPPPPARRAAPLGDTVDPAERSVLLVTEEDLSPGFCLRPLTAPVLGHAALTSVEGRSPRPVAAHVAAFTDAALRDSLDRHADRIGPQGPLTTEIAAIVDWARGTGATQIVTPYAPVGPTASKLRALKKALAPFGIALVQPLRDWDRAAWPQATHGFFRFKKEIPALLDGLA